MPTPEQIQEAQRHADRYRSAGFYLLVLALSLLIASLGALFGVDGYSITGYLLGYVGSAILVLASVSYAVAGVLVPVAEWHTPRQE